MSLRRLAIVAVILVAGCSKLHEQRSFEVASGGSHSLKISAPISEQTLAIVVTSDEPINVWVLLEKNLPEGSDDLEPDGLKEGVVAKEKNTKSVTLTATIPAKQAFRVYVNGVSKKAAVTVKVDSQ